jgi:hypothetical protein
MKRKIGAYVLGVAGVFALGLGAAACGSSSKSGAQANVVSRPSKLPIPRALVASRIARASRKVAGITLTLPKGKTRTLTAHCPAGTISTGGGYDTKDNVIIISSTPFNAGNGWRVRARNAGATTATLFIDAVCITAG